MLFFLECQYSNGLWPSYILASAGFEQAFGLDAVLLGTWYLQSPSGGPRHHERFISFGSLRHCSQGVR